MKKETFLKALELERSINILQYEVKSLSELIENMGNSEIADSLFISIPNMNQLNLKNSTKSIEDSLRNNLISILKIELGEKQIELSNLVEKFENL